MKEQVKQLWKLCFSDSDAFTDLYFNLRYRDDINQCIEKDNQVIAALQVLPYPMTFGKGIIETAYISGACTHPAYRNQGIMRQLLLQAHTYMWHKGAMLSTLIPAEDWLFGYYARSGYAAVFAYTEEQAAYTPHLPLQPFRLQCSCDFSAAGYAYLDRKLRERPNCIQHTETDFQVILADLRLSQGVVCTLHTPTDITALAVAYPREEGWFLGELAADNDEARQQLIQHFCRAYGQASISLLTPPVPGQSSRPLGMARIIRAHDLLQRYAAAHPHSELRIALTDNELEANNGYYYLSNGTCTKSAKQLPGSHLALTIGQLAEQICSTPAPYMSLMQN